MKHATIALFVFALSCITPSVHAFEASFPSSIHQGSTVQVLVPKQDIKQLTGSLNKKPFTFYPLTQVPADGEAISRGAFLDHLLKSGDFGAVTTGSGTLFPDIPQVHPYAQAVYEAQALGLVQGYEDGNFYPYDSLTRAQAAKILMTAFKPPLVLDTPTRFIDLPYTHSLSSYMYAAIRAKLFQGYGDGTVKPDRFLRYDEAEILLERATGKRAVIARQPLQYFRGLIGLHRTNDIGAKTLALHAVMHDNSTQDLVQDIQVQGENFGTATFTIPKGDYSVNADDKYNQTWEMIDGAKKTTNAQQLWQGAFMVPTVGEITLGFGEKMIIGGKYSGTHFGTDYANVTGTPVWAANNGVVAMAQETPYYGNVIILDHGQNVFTMYMHLSAILVTRGQAVQKGDTIGKIGATGIATGPHLHFTNFIGDVIVNSTQWYNGEF